jgi:hypothetical protein
MRGLLPPSSMAIFLSALGCARSEPKVEDPPALAASPVSPAPSEATAAAPPRRAPRPSEPPPVTLAGETRAIALSVVSSGPRLYARSLRAWIHERPAADSPKLGYMRAGASSPTSDAPAGHGGCPGGWYPVEPEGYVCAGRAATLDEKDPIVRATREHLPDPLRKLPYIYGSVRRPGPIYSRLPASEELRKSEPDIDDRMQQWLAADGEIGASYAQEVWLGGRGELADPAAAWRDKSSEPLPWFLADGRTAPELSDKRREPGLVLGRMRPKVGYAFLETFLFEGRRWGVTSDLTILPTDRLRPIRGSDFHGFVIGKEIEFPFAIVRRPDARLWIWQKSKDQLIDAGAAAYRSALKLTGKQQFFRKVLHFETTDGKWVSDRDASRLDPARRMPAWGKNGEKWMDVNLTKQTVVLYEGEKPVYATLISSGEAGLEDPARTTATKRGIFRIHTKHVTATMSSNEAGEEFELRDVPYVQYFDKEGYALHGAYWHDRFGTPKSHGCINLSPEDARRIFYWTDPPVPTGWHGRLLPLKWTVMFVHP